MEELFFVIGTGAPRHNTRCNGTKQYKYKYKINFPLYLVNYVAPLTSQVEELEKYVQSQPSGLPWHDQPWTITGCPTLKIVHPTFHADEPTSTLRHQYPRHPTPPWCPSHQTSTPPSPPHPHPHPHPSLQGALPSAIGSTPNVSEQPQRKTHSTPNSS